MKFSVGRHYTRDAVGSLIGMPPDRRKGGAWVTGYSRWNNEVYIFCNVGVAGRTGHDYPNRWVGKHLVWFGKTQSSADQPLIREMIDGVVPVHVFWRGRDRAPFTYAGHAHAVDVRPDIPVEVTWTFDGPMSGTLDVSAPEPAWRRGPPPSAGERTVIKYDGPTQLYLMDLEGPITSIMQDVPTGSRIIKVGISNDPMQRLKEMNAGFPPRSQLAWILRQAHRYPNGRDAYLAEGRCLEGLRVANRWIGGEFAVVPEGELDSILTQ